MYYKKMIDASKSLFFLYRYSVRDFSMELKLTSDSDAADHGTKESFHEKNANDIFVITCY